VTNLASSVTKADIEPSQPPTIVCHEFMGLPLWYAAKIWRGDTYHGAFVAHEVPAARAAVEMDRGHDTRFYNVMRRAMRIGLSMDDVFGDQNDYFKNAMLKTAARCEHVLAVSDITAEELRFADRALRQKPIHLAYNGADSHKITLAQKQVSVQKLKRCAASLAGFEPSFVFTHVTRMAASKAIWRDITVMRHLDWLLHQRNETATFLVVASSIGQGRSVEDARRMAQSYGWPRDHRVGAPDLVDQEVDLWRNMAEFNRNARASRIVFVNQCGFGRDRLGYSISEEIEFIDLRRGTDLEFGQSIYEPFGIAQIEPLTYGSLCLLSSVCGCVSLTRNASAEESRNLIVADYTSLSYPIDLRGALRIGQRERDDIEQRVSWDVAQTVIERLPRNDTARESLIHSGYALASRMSWDVIAQTQFLPSITAAAS
jgi:hypothetical protein